MHGLTIVQQQTSLFKAQKKADALLSDQAAVNAAKQFNSASINQNKQFTKSLQADIKKFNSTQINSMREFNVSERNAIKQFNSTMDAQRRQFNATNALLIAQANTQWRQNVTTANNAAKNEANLRLAESMNSLTGQALDAVYQKERDVMAFAFTASENSADRSAQIALAKLTGQQKADLQDSIGKGQFFGSILNNVLDNWGSIFG
jgi:hypothetical protein